MNLKVISVDRLFIVFVLQWKISYQAILWCAFTFKLARALIALFNGTYLPIKLHIFRYILISFLWYTLFSFKIDFLAYLHVVKFSLRTSSISSEKGYIVHRLWNIGQKLPCQILYLMPHGLFLFQQTSDTDYVLPGSTDKKSSSPPAVSEGNKH